MKIVLPLFLFLWASQVAGQAFITTWSPGISDISGQYSITIPTTGTGYSYSISWEKWDNKSVHGSIPGPITGSYTITFPTWGVYSISITGSFPRIFLNEQEDGYDYTLTSDARKIYSVDQWGNIEWTSMAHAFQGCYYLTIPAVDAPNLSQVTDMSYMFYWARNFNSAIGSWNVSTVKDMSYMFYEANYFNQPLGDWDVGEVTDMSWMFFEADIFDQPIGSWNVSHVKNMNHMLAEDYRFNQPIGDWDVSNVTDMNGMFSVASRFNQPLDTWNVSSVTDMASMFNFALEFNQPLETWDVRQVMDMSFMFSNAKNFNQPLGAWNISNVTDMTDMLSNSGLDIDSYDQTLIGWAAQDVKTNVHLGAKGLKYCAGEAARNYLITNKGWTITGDSKGNLPAPAVALIQPLCQGTTGTIMVTTENEGGMYSFDNGITFQSSNTRSGLAPGTYSIIIKNNSGGCSSNPAVAVMNPPLYAYPAPSVSGSPIVCPNVTAVDYMASSDQYTYKWFIDGGTLLAQQNNKIKVDWGPVNDNATVNAIGYDEHSCPTDTATFPVNIQINLKPVFIEGIDSVCYNFRTGVPYQTAYTNGSVYTWFTDGGTVSDGQKTPLAKIDWADLGQYHLWVKEESTTSTDFCEGFSDTLTVTVFKDLAAITMNFVSVDYKDDKKIQIQWEASLLERISDLIIVSRRIAGSNEPWKVMATLEKNVQSFLDQNVETEKNIYEYKVEGFNKCDEGLQTVIHNTIKLDGDKVEEQELIDLFWNDYNGWEGVERYEIWRKLDGDSTYRLIEVTPGEITNYIGKHGADGFVHVLRVKAKKKNENTISWSNDIELDFENAIETIPNIITPNDDSKNEFFIIPRLNLYPDNYLTIYNRWGERVYEKINYTNDWNANGLYSALYYYSLYLARNHKTLKGWIQVVR